MKTFFKILSLLLIAGLFFFGGFLYGQQPKNASSTTAKITKSTSKTSQSGKLTEKSVKEKVNHGQKRIPVSKWKTQDSEVKIPILMYHDINTGNTLQMPEGELRDQMHWLKDEGYYFLSPKEAYIAFTKNKLPQEKVVWVTFDDGYKTMLTKGLPIFKEVGAYVTINVISGSLDGQYKINREETHELANATDCTVNIESHTVSHLDLNSMSLEQQIPEMTNSKKTLEDLLQKPVLEITYPAGHYDENSVTAAREAGYKIGLTTTPGLAQKSQGLLELHRVRMNPGMDKDTFMYLLNN